MVQVLKDPYIEIKHLSLNILYLNLQNLYKRFHDNRKKFIRSVNNIIIEIGADTPESQFDKIEGMIKSAISFCSPESRNPYDDKVRSIIGIFEDMLSYFPQYVKLLFKDYKEAPKFDGKTYAYIHEVEVFCKATEPKILKIVNRRWWQIF
ncbi:hypothetical protein HYU23_00735 [Candidatus Woesearchaeota archaeon]|nr:hypothetical protein [Candidatus Woesearchaeota archaeon]